MPEPKGLNDAPTVHHSKQEPPIKWVWALFGAMACVFVLLVFPVQNPNMKPVSDVKPNVDYVAILVDAESKPRLIVFGERQIKTLTLHWQTDNAVGNADNYQLWAVSNSNGQSSPIGIIENGITNEVRLSETDWKHIVEAAILKLTVAETEDTIIDPAEKVIASGVIARL